VRCQRGGSRAGAGARRRPEHGDGGCARRVGWGVHGLDEDLVGRAVLDGDDVDGRGRAGFVGGLDGGREGVPGCLDAVADEHHAPCGVGRVERPGEPDGLLDVRALDDGDVEGLFEDVLGGEPAGRAQRGGFAVEDDDADEVVGVRRAHRDGVGDPLPGRGDGVAARVALTGAQIGEASDGFRNVHNGDDGEAVGLALRDGGGEHHSQEDDERDAEQDGGPPAQRTHGVHPAQADDCERDGDEAQKQPHRVQEGDAEGQCQRSGRGHRASGSPASSPALSPVSGRTSSDGGAGSAGALVSAGGATRWARSKYSRMALR